VRSTLPHDTAWPSVTARPRPQPQPQPPTVPGLGGDELVQSAASTVYGTAHQLDDDDDDDDSVYLTGGEVHFGGNGWDI
jgi:hypothetical protein